jgi:hypothetical protein
LVIISGTAGFAASGCAFVPFQYNDAQVLMAVKPPHRLKRLVHQSIIHGVQTLRAIQGDASDGVSNFHGQRGEFALLHRLALLYVTRLRDRPSINVSWLCWVIDPLLSLTPGSHQPHWQVFATRNRPARRDEPLGLMDRVFRAQLLPHPRRIVIDEDPWVGQQAVNVHCRSPDSLSARSLHVSIVKRKPQWGQ